jgi:hypothetical protein
MNDYTHLPIGLASTRFSLAEFTLQIDYARNSKKISFDEQFWKASRNSIEAASSQIIKKAMALFEASKTRPENLEKLFRALKSIPPTSVEAERVFQV